MRFKIIIIFCLIPFCLFAQTPDLELLRSKVYDYQYLISDAEGEEIKSIEAHTISSDTILLVVNFLPEGWMLFSGDKKAAPLIAFNSTGSFSMPARNKYDPRYNYISLYIRQIEYLKKKKGISPHAEWDNNNTKTLSVNTKAGAVNPIISVEWNQGAGWNRFCPEDADGPGGYAYVGCVAVSMAQAMSVFKYPTEGESSNTYYLGDYGTITEDFSLAEYKWDSMSLKSSDQYNALILYHCAVSVDMDFGPDGSSALTTSARTAMRDYFSMSAQIKYKSRRVYPDTWNDMMIAELKEGRPIIYKGDADNGEPGHAFNIDGVIEDKYFHINWGWGGSQNGFFALDALAPGTNDFTENQAALIGIKPYYFPTGITLSNYLVPEDMPAGSAIGKVSVLDEASDNEYTLALLCDSSYIEDKWLMDYILDEDTLRTGRVYPDGELLMDTISINVTDKYQHSISPSIVLLFADTSSSTAVSDDIIRDFILYPNPAREYLRLSNNSEVPMDFVRIYSINGYLIKSIKPGSRSIEYNVSGIPAGVYIVEVGFADNRVSRKKLLIL